MFHGKIHFSNGFYWFPNINRSIYIINGFLQGIVRHPGPASRDQGGVRGRSGEGQEKVKEGSREDQVANISTLLPYFTISLKSLAFKRSFFENHISLS